MRILGGFVVGLLVAGTVGLAWGLAAKTLIVEERPGFTVRAKVLDFRRGNEPLGALDAMGALNRSKCQYYKVSWTRDKQADELTIHINRCFREAGSLE